ncbi:hypothetical protein FHX42_001303 [Saccharopolyspora lacisalsi]|uniref:Uncharacterized protein n=1 Tax=Halosaccharopolyspora lacisalsi TaxID=1000566 RepID=A0A839DR30_9PSEU|nr:hypothetical protein [Halosaccharopolyspora lacisalsi]
MSGLVVADHDADAEQAQQTVATRLAGANAEQVPGQTGSE